LFERYAEIRVFFHLIFYLCSGIAGAAAASLGIYGGYRFYLSRQADGSNAEGLNTKEVGKTLDAVKDSASQAGSDLADSLKDGASQASSKIASLADGASQASSKVADSLKEGASQVSSKVSDSMKNLDIPKPDTSGAVDTVKKVATKVEQSGAALSDKAGTAKKDIEKAAADTIPSFQSQDDAKAGKAAPGLIDKAKDAVQPTKETGTDVL
jgi:X-X-X-Leu-X-X-Gly heptad repeat protein